MRVSRLSAVLLAVCMVVDLVAAFGAVGLVQFDPGSAFGSGLRHVKVVVIVGPVGAKTDVYRAMGAAAAAAARKRSDQVVTIYSPDATWPVVRRALDGAAIVVYLGHGNGWPSIYRDAPFPKSQNGLGLNPVAGNGDSTHQYFGETYLRQQVHLAPGAIVVLGHLCYASGDAEPGMPDPTLDVAQQRVDNFGAGWIAAGAAAVVAEGHGKAAYYVDALLRGQTDIERIWADAPTFHDHVIESASVRTPGAVVRLDPDTRTRGYFRSLVVRAGSGAGSRLAESVPKPAEPIVEGGPADSLAARGATLAAARLAGPIVAGGQARLSVRFDKSTKALLPKGLVLGSQWTTITAQGEPVTPEPNAALASPAPGTDPGLAPADPAATIDPNLALAAPAPAPADLPAIDLVQPETPATTLVTATASGKGVDRSVDVAIPAQPGLYRLTTTLHHADGVAYDAATQDLVTPLFVRVSGRLWATYGLDEQIGTAADAPLALRVRLANTGSEAWGVRPTEDLVDPGALAADVPPRLIARWVALDEPQAEPVLVPDTSATVHVDAGTSTIVELLVAAPPRPGQYLLMFDVLLPDGRSLAANGVPPGIMRVTITAATLVPAASPSPAPDPAADPGAAPSDPPAVQADQPG